jgi:hypothetical protein
MSAADQALRETVAGLVLMQQVLIEAMIRYDMIGYPQAHAALEEALAVLAADRRVTPAMTLPLRKALALLDERHRPFGPGERPHPVDWSYQLGDTGLAWEQG